MNVIEASVKNSDITLQAFISANFADKEPSAFVSGVLAMVLRVSRLACVAPLRFTKQRGGWRISLSGRLHVYGCILLTFLNTIVLTATLLDFLAEPAQSIRMQSSTRRIVWLLDVAIMTGIVFYGGFTAQSHLTAIINCINRTQQISIELNVSNWSKRGEKKMIIFLFMWTFLSLSMTLADHAMQLTVIRKQQGFDLVCVLYTCYYFCYWIMQLLIYQFVLIVLHIRRSFTAVNYKLEHLDQGISGITVKDHVTLEPTLHKKRKKSVNSIIDSLAFVGKPKTVDGHRPTHEKVRRLALMYLSVCDEVRELDRRYGVILVLLLASFLLHMTITPYYLLNHVFIDNENRGSIYILLQCVWCVYHGGCLVMVIEPCHLTQQEMVGTRSRISILMRQLSSSMEPLAVELDLFFKYLTLNQVSYSPLQITTLTRGLVATIVSTIITYLVVIIQL